MMQLLIDTLTPFFWVAVFAAVIFGVAVYVGRKE